MLYWVSSNGAYSIKRGFSEDSEDEGVCVTYDLVHLNEVCFYYFAETTVWCSK